MDNTKGKIQGYNQYQNITEYRPISLPERRNHNNLQSSLIFIPYSRAIARFYMQQIGSRIEILKDAKLREDGALHPLS